MKKEMATHSSTLALKIPWPEELGAGYYPWGHKELGTTERLHPPALLGCALSFQSLQPDFQRLILPTQGPFADAGGLGFQQLPVGCTVVAHKQNSSRVHWRSKGNVLPLGTGGAFTVGWW